MLGLFSGELIFGGAYYRNFTEFSGQPFSCVLCFSNLFQTENSGNGALSRENANAVALQRNLASPNRFILRAFAEPRPQGLLFPWRVDERPWKQGVHLLCYFPIPSFYLRACNRQVFFGSSDNLTQLAYRPVSPLFSLAIIWAFPVLRAFPHYLSLNAYSSADSQILNPAQPPFCPLWWPGRLNGLWGGRVGAPRGGGEVLPSKTWISKGPQTIMLLDHEGSKEIWSAKKNELIYKHNCKDDTTWKRRLCEISTMDYGPYEEDEEAPPEWGIPRSPW